MGWRRQRPSQREGGRGKGEKDAGDNVWTREEKTVNTNIGGDNGNMTLILFMKEIVSFITLSFFIVQPIEILQGIQHLIPLVEIMLET